MPFTDRGKEVQVWKQEGRKFTFGSAEVPSEYPQGEDPVAID